MISGCATAHKKETPAPVAPIPIVTPAPVEEKPKGVYHKVSKQESLWRIAKTYGVAVDEIVKANKIPNAAVIEENQLILIPGANELKQVVPSVTKSDDKPDEFAWPVRGRIVSYFKDVQGQQTNRGIDIIPATGEDIRAARDGKVVFADYLSGYGYTVILDHLDGYYSVYARQADLTVKPADLVTKGMPLGRLAKGANPFLHFEIRKFEEPNNPLYYLP